MKIEKIITIAPSDLIELIKFNGETYSDSLSVESIKELENLLHPVFYELILLSKKVENRSEKSAKEISKALKEMRTTLLWNLVTVDDIETLKEIIEEVENGI